MEGVVQVEEVGGETQALQPARTVGAVVGFVTLSVLYLLFISHYSVNILDNDDWTVLPLVHVALHGQLSWGALWAQHNENRMLVPNVASWLWESRTRENVQVVTFVKRRYFIATFATFLVLFRAYVGRLSAWAVLATGVVWFSVADWMNALWAFQLAWYAILGFLVAMLYLLLVRWERWAFAVALACAVLASYSSLQGLLLWPVGLLCLMWVRPWPLRRVAAWVSLAAVATALYFVGYQSAPPAPDGLFPTSLFGATAASASPSYALSHPIFTIRFVLVIIGDGFPLHFDAKDPWVAEVVGAAVLVAALYVVGRAVLRRQSRIECLPVALISFGLLFDLIAGIGRVKYGFLDGAFASRYSIGGLLIMVAILTYVWANVRARLPLTVVLVCLLTLQFATSAHYGIEQSVANRKTLDSAARFVANEEPPRGCAAVNVFFDFVPPGLTASFMQSMKADRLNVFAPGPLAHYRAEGLPKLRSCKGF